MEDGSGISSTARTGLVSLKHIKSQSVPFIQEVASTEFIEKEKSVSPNDVSEDSNDSDDEEGVTNTKPSIRLRPNAQFLTRYVGGCERTNSKVDSTPIPKEDIEITMFRKKGESLLKRLANYYGLTIEASCQAEVPHGYLIEKSTGRDLLQHINNANLLQQIVDQDLLKQSKIEHQTSEAITGKSLESHLSRDALKEGGKHRKVKQSKRGNSIENTQTVKTQSPSSAELAPSIPDESAKKKICLATQQVESQFKFKSSDQSKAYLKTPEVEVKLPKEDDASNKPKLRKGVIKLPSSKPFSEKPSAASVDATSGDSRGVATLTSGVVKLGVAMKPDVDSAVSPIASPSSIELRDSTLSQSQKPLSAGIGGQLARRAFLSLRSKP